MASNSLIEEICGDYFMLNEETWNTTSPHLSQCFQHTVLVFLPCTFFWLFLPSVLYALHKSDNVALRWAFPILLKITISSILSIDALALFFLTLYERKFEEKNLAPIWLIYPLMFYLTLASTIVVLIACRNRGLITSGVLFIFWLLLTICGLPEFRWWIEKAVDAGGIPDENTARFVLYMIWYPLVVAQLVISCFADQTAYFAGVEKQNPCPELQTSFLNQITFHWFTGLAITGNKRPLEVGDLWSLNDRDLSKTIVPDFEKHWLPSLRKYNFAKYQYDKRQRQAAANAAEEVPMIDGNLSPTAAAKAAGKPPAPPSVLWPLFKTYRSSFVTGFLFKFMFDLLQFASPQLLSLLISFIEHKERPLWQGIVIAGLMFTTALIQSMILHQYFHNMFRLGMNIRSVLTSAVFTKSLRLSNAERKNRTVGEIVNLMSVDVQRFQDMTTFVMLFWSAPLQVGLSLFFLWRLLGVSVLAGLAILIAMVPLNSFISIKMRRFQVVQMKHKDDRIKMMSEILNGIKVLKLYAWEASMEKMVLEIRQKEIAVLRKLAFLNAATTLSWSCAPFLVAVLTFGVYVVLDPVNNVLTPQVTFVALALFNILRFPLAIFAMIISQAVQCTVSNKRLKSFLSADEMDSSLVDKSPSSLQGAIVVENGNFSWDKTAELTLKDINIRLPRGKLIAIVGRVGTGKSSLLSALLGEMNKQSGYVGVNGTIAYVPQQAWIQNLSVRDNIVFGQKFDQQWYDTVLDSCALRADIATLPAGDETEIGEKGINLSGGQKQRVSLARAVYQQRDVVLLDDPLSAVDAHVGKHIFEQVFSNETGLLRGKTRVLVTHGLHFLKHCNLIIVLKDGAVSETGSYQQLLTNAGSFAEYLEEFLIQEAKNRGRSISFNDDADADEVTEVLADISKADPDRHRRIETQLSQVATIGSQDSFESIDSESETSKSGARSSSKTRDDPQFYSPNRRKRTHTDSSNRSDVEKQPLMENGDSKEASAAIASSRRRSSERASRRNGASNLPANATADIIKTALVDGKPVGGDQLKSKLIEKEGVETGQVKRMVYVTYIRAIGYGISLIFVSIYIFSSVLGVFSNLWLAYWSDDSAKLLRNETMDMSTGARLGIYTALGFGQAISVCLASIIMALGMVLASRTLHEGILHNILRSPMSFFDVTPLGRILNRMGKDIDVLDGALPESLRMFVWTATSVLMTLMVIIYATPAFVIVIVPLMALYIFVLRFYVSTSRQLKRLESVSRSPIYSHFQEAVQGAPSIRAYNVVDRFVDESERRVDANLVAYYPNICANRWLAVRLELVGNAIVLFAALFAVLFRETSGITAGLVGLSVSYALNITQTLNWAVRMTSELETNIVAVERIKEYSETPTEASLYATGDKKPPPDWPNKGTVEIENLKLRYRTGLELVLKGISVKINAQEKVGIVGRTGAGKSSMTLALFRIVEADAGRILIDGRDIAHMGLDDLRSKLTIVPQDPVLFSGTLRINLDPFEKYSDERIWSALRMAHLQPFVASLADGLKHRVSEGGENLSVGQRQLVCLARALLRKTKVLILDEAAAAVDLETDALLQKTIREEFVDCTVLTIAHRLNTVLDSDRILVLEQGEVAEFDSPKNLLANDRSIFYALAKDAGITK